MKRKTLSFINRCLAAVMALLGFQACDFPIKYGVPVEYGVPYVEFQIRGKVTNTQQEPLKDMQVAVKAEDTYASQIVKTLYTDENGEYDWQELGRWGSDSVKIIVNDTTGKFASDSAKVAFSYDRTKADDWYEGLATAEADFELKEKE